MPTRRAINQLREYILLTHLNIFHAFGSCGGILSWFLRAHKMSRKFERRASAPLVIQIQYELFFVNNSTINICAGVVNKLRDGSPANSEGAHHSQTVQSYSYVFAQQGHGHDAKTKACIRQLEKCSN